MGDKLPKAILIYPRFPVALKFNIPIGLLHLATYLKAKGFEVKLIDCNIEDNYKGLIAEEIKDAICIGISVMTAQIIHARDLCVFIKNELNANMPLIMGGVHPTLYPQETLNEEFVDYVVIGEGELAMFNLLHAIKNDNLGAVESLAGIAYKDRNGNLQLNPGRDLFNYTEMPHFDYSVLNPRVFTAYKKEETYFPLLSSRGCPYRCAFCINVVIKNIKWRAFSAERTVAEIERIIKMGFKRIWFWDENFFVNKQRIEEIMHLLELKNIKFEGYAAGRADYIRHNYLNQELLIRLKKRGFHRIGFGFESGSQRILDYLQKDITVEQILNAVRHCSEAGIRTSGSFMVGLPIENEEDVRKTIDIIGKISSISPNIGINGPQFYRPYPGSKIYQDCLKSGWIEPKNFQEWSLRIERDFYSTPNPYKTPWIKEPALVNTVYFYAYALSVSTKNLLSMFREFCRMTKRKGYFIFFGSIALFLLSLLGKLRYRLGFFHFLIEKKIFYKYHPNLDY